MRQSARFDDSSYTRLRRVKHVFWFFREMVNEGPIAFEKTVSRHIARTFGLETETVKRIKARFRNELSFGEGK